MIRAMRGRRHAEGLTLIELMIAMLLGLLIVGAAIGIFVSNSQAYRSTQNLSRIQETGHIAFEMLAKDIREAGANPCDASIAVANVINNPTSNWYTNWTQPIRGYGNGALLGSKAGTDAIHILRESDDAITVTGHSGTDLEVKANPLSVGSLAMVCDHRQLALFRVSAASATTIGHAASGGNCSDLLGAVPAPCAAGAVYSYPANSVVSGLRAVRWYVAANGRGGSSLFMQTGPSASTQEIAEGVTDMQFTYLQPDISATTYLPATSIAANLWGGVKAVRVVLTIEGPDANTAVGGGKFSRRIEHVINLRNRNP